MRTGRSGGDTLDEHAVVLAGIVRRVAQTNQTLKDAPVADLLGRLAASVAMIEAGVLATEAACEPVPGSTSGAVRPNARLMYRHDGLGRADLRRRPPTASGRPEQRSWDLHLAVQSPQSRPPR
jgi:hypothetical protein